MTLCHTIIPGKLNHDIMLVCDTWESPQDSINFFLLGCGPNKESCTVCEIPYVHLSVHVKAFVLCAGSSMAGGAGVKQLLFKMQTK